MKKNVFTKILIALVLAMMVLALVACGGNGGSTNKGGNKDNNKTEECKEHVDANKDGKCDKCGKDMPAEEKVDVIGKVVDIVKNVSGLIETVTSITADGTVSLETALTAYYTMGKNEGNAAINLAANASANDPEISMGVAVNDKDYFTLGYSAATLYLLEGLNLVNSTATSSNKIAMDVTALEPGVKSAMGEAMKALASLGANEMLQNLDFEAIGEELRDTVAMFEDVINELLVITGDDKGAKLELKAEALKNLLDPDPSNGILSGLLGDKYTNILDTIDSALSTLGIEIGEGNNKQALTVDLLLNDYLPTIVIEVKYNSSKSISGIKVYFTIENLDLEAGLDLALPTFSTKAKDKVDISFKGYTAQDLKTSIGLAFPQKGLSAVLDIVANTSTAFAKDGNQVGGSIMTINGDADNKTFASFDGKTVYLDFTGAFRSLGYTDMTGMETVYAYTMEKSLVEYINDALTGIKFEDEKASNAASDNEGGIWATLYSMVAVNMFGAQPKANATQEDCVKFVYNLLGEDKYFTFLDAKDTTFMAMGARIVAIYNLNKTSLLNAVYAGTENNVYRAGVQIIDVDEDGTISGGLIKFLSAFINIPTIVENNDGTYTVDTEHTMKLENVDTVVDYIEAAFKLYEGTHKAEINSGMISRLIYGTAPSGALKQILSGGIYIGVGSPVNGGLDGYIEVRATKDGAQYGKLSGQLVFIESGSECNTLELVPEDISAVRSFAGKYEVGSEEEDCEYYIQANLYRLFRCALLYVGNAQ